MKKPAKKKTMEKAKPKAARDYFSPVPPDHPIYQTGYVVGGRYPAPKKQPTEREELDRIASELAIKHNADAADEEIKREAVYQHLADRARREQLSHTGLGAQLSKTIEDVLAEVDDEAARQVLEQFQRNLTGKNNPAKTPEPLTASQLAKRYGLEPTTIASLKASQAKLKAMGRDRTPEEVCAFEMTDTSEE